MSSLVDYSFHAKHDVICTFLRLGKGADLFLMLLFRGKLVGFLYTISGFNLAEKGEESL